MRFTVGGDAAHYTVGANAALLLLLVHVLPFTILLGSMLAKKNRLHMFGQLLPVAERILQFAEIRCFTAFNSASGDQSVYCGTWGQTAFLFGCGRTHLFYSWSWYYTTILKAAGVIVTRHPWSQEQSCSNQHYCRLNRPPIVRSVGGPPCSESILRILTVRIAFEIVLLIRGTVLETKSLFML